MRKKIIAGNWKMNTFSKDAQYLVKEIEAGLKKEVKAEVLIFPPSIYAQTLYSDLKKIQLGLQNFYPAEKGAFTGEISVTQLKDIGATHVLIGHSERRAYFMETNSFLREKVDCAIKHGIKVVFCCGEPLEIREKGAEKAFVKQQLLDSLFHLSKTDLYNVTIAYEPIWAIGTGITATSDQAEEMHAEIRSWIAEFYSESVSHEISILYGGSCNPSNAKELFSCPNVDGGLIGGASLEADSFLQIINAL